MRWWRKLKVFKCYLFILAWIGIILITYSYWKIESDDVDYVKSPSKVHIQSSIGVLTSNKMRSKKVRMYCNSPEKIKLGHEGEINEDYELYGIVVMIRHGDRGPLMQVRNMSSINCGHRKAETALYKNYVADIVNITHTKGYTQKIKEFKKFPILPAPTRCTVGHLTSLGVSQHLKLGKLLRNVYVENFSLLSGSENADDVAIASTKFKRTFQSAMAFTYSFLPRFDISKFQLESAEGSNMCGDFCQCERASIYERKFRIERKEYLKMHPSVSELVSNLNPLIKAHDYDDDITSPYVMTDALMAYVCHGANYPCVGKICVSSDDLTKLLSYEEWENRQKGAGNRLKTAKLNSFGFLNQLLDTITSIVRKKKPKLTLYSAHDKTITDVLLSLGVQHFQAPYYASRLILEIYRNNSMEETENSFSFRLIYNGKDITKQLTFCKLSIVKKVILAPAKPRGIGLCSVQSLRNFIQSADYFKEFNAKSFKEACMK